MKLIAIFLALFAAIVAADDPSTFSTYYTTCSVLYATTTELSYSTVMAYAAHPTTTPNLSAAQHAPLGTGTPSYGSAPAAAAAATGSGNGTVAGAAQPSVSPNSFTGAASDARIGSTQAISAVVAGLSIALLIAS